MTATTDTAGANAAEREDLATMTFAEHLEELRRRLVVSLAAVFAVMIFFLFQHDRVMAFVMGPYDAMWSGKADEWYDRESKIADDDVPEFIRARRRFVLGNFDKIKRGEKIPGVDLQKIMPELGMSLPRNLISVTPLQDIVTFMIAALLCGLAVGSPIVLHQMWRFIGAGLYRRERAAVMKFLPASILLFAGGMSFGYLVMVPTALQFLYGLSTTEFLLTIRDYFRFLFVLTIALGFVFQLPVVMVGLVTLGLTTPATYIRYWRQVILTLFVVGAVFTPPDPVTQILMALPMIALFLLGIVLSVFVHRRQQAKEPA